MDKRQALKDVFGHDAFRQGQEELIDAVLSGRDALGVMPTGGGKSLCYQVPALLQPGLTLVVSPLISLMKDQVTALEKAGVAAACLSSAQTEEQRQAVYQGLREGRYRLVYVAPERLDAASFVSLARQLPIELVAVDEAHCISQWGQNFRPSYLRIPDFLEKLRRRPVVAAFTATATGRVREDIRRLLGLEEPLEVVTGFDRPNLFYQVLRPDDKLSALLALTGERRRGSGIVYCATRKTVESVCAALQEAGRSATRYHAGLSPEERRHDQEDFLFDRRAVMVATNAFGMGIDKSNVSYVIHYNMPKSLEAYYQEAGRAGRDGTPADCLLLFAPGDVVTARYLIQSGGDNEELTDAERAQVTQQELRRLETMAGYCKTRACLRGVILDYFGQTHPARCGNCGNCRAELTRQDVTTQAQMILSCVKRARDRLGYSVGAALIARTLCGSRERRLLELGLDKLSTYGLMKDVARPQVRAYIELLEEDGYLKTDPDHGALRLTEKADAVLFHGESVFMTVSAPTAAEKKRGRRKKAPAEVADDSLFEALRAIRTRLAQAEDVPAYVIFSNATLADMAEKAPETMAEFLDVSGVGAVKARKYGKVFLEGIAAYQTEKE